MIRNSALNHSNHISKISGRISANISIFSILTYLNRIDTILHCKSLSALEVWEQNTCILFMKGLVYTLTSYDIIIYEKGFYENGMLFIPLPHCAGTSDLEIKIDEFDEKFNRFCEQYQKYECF